MGEQELVSFVESVCGDSHLRVETDLGDGFVRLKSAEAERRQAAHDIRATEDVVIEMLRNSRDADAGNIFLAVTREGNCRRIAMVDDGVGIPASMQERIFEPRVTSKLDTMHFDKWGVHGRGMALYSITVNAQVAKVMASAPGLGAALLVETDLTQLGEKADQSTFPTFEQTEAGSYAMRGPRNILRTASEFALECRRDCTVYVGSATDVAATLYEFGCATLGVAQRAFCSNVEDVPVCKRLATASDPAHFAQLAAGLGLFVSERSARRIMDGTIAPLDPLLDRIRTEGFASVPPAAGGGAAPSARRKAGRDERGLKIAPDDSREFAARIKEAFSDIAARYYLESEVEPEIKATKGALCITIPVEKLR